MHPQDAFTRYSERSQEQLLPVLQLKVKMVYWCKSMVPRLRGRTSGIKRIGRLEPVQLEVLPLYGRIPSFHWLLQKSEYTLHFLNRFS